MSKFSSEMLFQIFNDSTGERINVGPDRDGLDLVEIREHTSNGDYLGSIIMPAEQARLVGEALIKVADQAKNQNPHFNEIKNTYNADGKIIAVKKCRELMQIGLLEAKLWVEKNITKEIA